MLCYFFFITDVSSTEPLAYHDMFLFMTDVSSTGPLTYHVMFYEWFNGVTYNPILLDVSFECPYGITG